MTTDNGLGRGRYLKKKIQDAINKQDRLFLKIYKFKKQPKKAKRLGIKNKSYGKWIKRKYSSKKDVEAYLKIKRANERAGY